MITRRFFEVAGLVGLMGTAWTQPISGVVQSASDATPLAGASVVLIEEGRGTTTDATGRFQITPRRWPARLGIYLLGYDTVHLTFRRPPPHPLVIRLREQPLQLGPVVVAESRRPIRHDETIRSLETLPVKIHSTFAAPRLDQALEYLPGAQLFKGQLNLRGGSGFTYGAGSRIALVWREMPFLTADVGDIRWNYFPLLHIQRVEVLKGPASALYGAGALEGVVVLTDKTAPEGGAFDAEVQQGIYEADASLRPAPISFATVTAAPADSSIYLPFRTLGQAGYRRRIGRLQLFGSALWEADNGYRRYDENIRRAVHGRIRWTAPRAWIVEASAGAMHDTGFNFLFAPDLRRPYLSSFLGANPYRTRLRHLDATVTHLTTHGKTFAGYRLTSIHRGGTPEIYSHGLTHHAELRHIHSWGAWTWTGGLRWTAYRVASPHLYGRHRARQAAVFIHGEWRHGPWRVVGGLRGETYRIDQDTPWYYPAVRLGVNRRIGPGRHIYAAVGQGVRPPSVAERYIQSTTGGIKIFPNPTLQPEYGWTVEVGGRQAFHAGKWWGRYEAAFYRMDFRQMVEFQFGLWLPDTFDPRNTFQYLGFSARNTTSARIWGTEHKLAWRRQGADLRYEGWLAVTLTHPIDRTRRAADSPDYFLRYRTPRMAKTYHRVRKHRWEAFTALQYYGPLTGVDPPFEAFIAGLSEYLQEHTGSWLWDAGIGYALGEKWRLRLVVKNLLNARYMPVPGNVGPPRQWTLTFNYTPQ